jgi:hypothetical protein
VRIRVLPRKQGWMIRGMNEANDCRPAYVTIVNPEVLRFREVRALIRNELRDQLSR